MTIPSLSISRHRANSSSNNNNNSSLLNNWCPTCQESCLDHHEVCTVCGERLEAPPPPPPFSTPAAATFTPRHSMQQPPALPPPPRLRLVPATNNSQELSELQENSRDLLELLRSLRQRIHSLQAAVEGAGNVHTNNNNNSRNGGDWQLDMLPPEAWDPQAGGASLLRSRPVAAAYLANIPRIVLDPNSSLFHEITLRLHPAASEYDDVVDDGRQQEFSKLKHRQQAKSSTEQLDEDASLCVVMHPVMGEFGKPPTANKEEDDVAPQSTLQRVPLIVAEPKTGKGGDLSAATKFEIHQVLRHQKNIATTSTTSSPTADASTGCGFILYMERGDNITFVQKAIMAQRAGASAVIIGNNTDFTWPYIMKDTAGEAPALGLNIPVVMVQQRDGKTIVQRYRSHQQQQQKLQNDNISNAASSSSFLLVSLDMTLHEQQQECVVCREVFEVGQTVMRLPSCGHVFHEPCAMAWLTRNNTCPYCRGEMPTEQGDERPAAAAAARPPPPPPLGTSTHRSSHVQDLYR